MSAVDASRIEKVEVDISFPCVSSKFAKGVSQTVDATLRENDARDLMHAIASALGYTFTKKA